MANGIKALRQIQMSRETTQGSPTTDNWTLWRGTGTIQDTRVTTFVEEDVGNIPGYDRTYVAYTGGELALDPVEATFEQLVHIFDAGFYKVTATTDTGTGSGYIREWTLPTTSVYSSSDLQTYYFKAGDNNEMEIAGFGFVREFTLSGAAGEAWKIGATYETREVTTSPETWETVSIPAVDELLFTKTTLYIDNAAASSDMGKTEVSSTLLGAELSVKTGWQSVHNASGQTYFGYIKQTRPEILLKLTYEHNASASAEKSNWRNQTARLIRLKCVGDTLTSAGTYSTRTVLIDLCGKYESFEKLSEQNGNDIIACTFRARFNTTANRFAAFTIVNDNATY